MGLDMYLEKYPRYKNAKPSDVYLVQSYLEWKKAKSEGESYANCTLKKWCGREYKELNRDFVEFYRPYYTEKFYSWDKACKYGHFSIVQDIGYWRKVNHVHNWFVKNVQNGVDDCGAYIVTKVQLHNLLNVCKKVMDIAILKEDRIINYNDVAEILPTVGGFFFGGTDYDSYYLNGVQMTIEILEKVLKETDFSEEVVYYSSSW